MTRSGCVLALGRWKSGELLRRRADDCQPGAWRKALGASVPACKFLCGISECCNRHFTRIPGDRLRIFGTISCRICGNFNGDFSAVFGGFSARESGPLREHPNPEPDSGSNPNWNPKSKKVPCHFLMIFELWLQDRLRPAVQEMLQPILNRQLELSATTVADRARIASRPHTIFFDGGSDPRKNQKHLQIRLTMAATSCKLSCGHRNAQVERYNRKGLAVWLKYKTP